MNDVLRPSSRDAVVEIAQQEEDVVLEVNIVAFVIPAEHQPPEEVGGVLIVGDGPRKRRKGAGSFKHNRSVSPSQAWPGIKAVLPWQRHLDPFLSSRMPTRKQVMFWADGNGNL